MMNYDKVKAGTFVYCCILDFQLALCILCISVYLLGTGNGVSRFGPVSILHGMSSIELQQSVRHTSMADAVSGFGCQISGKNILRCIQFFQTICDIVESLSAVGSVLYHKTPVDQKQNAGQWSLEDHLLTGQWVVQCCCRCWVDDWMDISYLFSTPLRNLQLDFPTVIDIKV
jgi:hypothetical protein